jgi:hypothetical protein
MCRFCLHYYIWRANRRSGIFGLNNQPVNYTAIGNFTAQSFFTNLKTQEKIPSLSWSYTAGAKYRTLHCLSALLARTDTPQGSKTDNMRSSYLEATIHHDSKPTLRTLSWRVILTAI